MKNQLAALQQIQITDDLNLVFPDFRCVGGAKTETHKVREDHEGNALEVESNVIRTVADVDEYERGKSLARSALRKIERVATRTPYGLTVRTADLPEIERGLDEIRHEIVKYNVSAVHSQIVAKYDKIAISIALNEGLANKMADHVRGIFERIKEAILTDTDRLHAAMVASENVARLATGIQRESAELALQQAREAQREIRGRIKRGVSAATAGNDLPVDMIDNAIALFTY